MATSHGGALAAALHDLQHIFGERLQAVVAFGQPGANPAPCLALVRAINAADLDECAARLASWHRAGCATPLLLTKDEFAGSLDAFPIEYGEILDTRRMIFGVDPFAGLTIETEDLRRECETLVKSHLVHLRENYMECQGRQADVGALVAEAAPHFARILRRLARLDGAPALTNTDLGAYAARRPGLDARVVGDVLALAGNHSAGVDAVRIYPAYLSAVEQLWRFIDGWQATARE
ncbi:MAG TPA: hypothetical protein VM096_19980 [Vicinamibacterales bacterium]|nr:hypothetical protein [Vicinamibacterales bacterium]